MDDQVPTASTPVYKVRTKNRQRSNKPYERPPQSFREKIVDSVSSIVPDWLKNAASFLTNAETEEVDVQEQSVLSPGSSRSSLYQELPSEIRDASIRPSLSVLREEQEGQNEPQETNSECNENHTKNLSQHISHNVHRETDDGQRASTGEAPTPVLPRAKEPTTRGSLSVGTMNRLEIPEDNLKRLKVNLSKRSRLSMPFTSGSSMSVSPPAKASRHETSVDADTSRFSRNNSELFKMSNASFSSSFTFGPRSPFYDGKTSFGGSCSRRMSRLAYPYSMAGRKIAPVLKVRASEMAKSDPGKSEALSCASMKILDVINKESSLLEDTKKIPLNDSGLSNRTVFNNFVKSSSSRRVSSTRTRLSMPSHITTSVLNKSIASTHQSDTNNLDWRLNPNTFADDADSVARENSHKTLLQESTVTDKVGGKMKSSISKSSLSNRSSSKVIEETETAPAVDLPQVSLPLKSLPSFNLEFKKSEPLTKDVNQFKFSWPSTYSDSTRDLPKVNSTAKAFTFSTPSKESSESSHLEAEINPSNISTNITPATSSESSAISDASWSCPTCIIRNDPQVIKCLACKTLKPDTNEKRESAPKVNSSSSSSNNNNNNTNTNTNINTNTTNNNKVDSSSSITNATITSSWGDKFKKAPGTWTCDVCMVDNKAEHNKCVACETEKPGCQAVASSSISTDSANVIVPNVLSKKWTCDTCYVTNEDNRDTCISCEMSRKTGDNLNTKAANYSGYKFNLTDKSPPPFKFGCTESSTTSNASSTPTIAFKFGSGETSAVSNVPATSTIAFKFGSSESSTVSNPPPPPPTTTTTSTVSFKFGSTETSTQSSAPPPLQPPSTTSAIDFKFGCTTESSTVSNVAASSVSPPPTAPATTSTTGFKFGCTETSTVSNAPTTSTIGFPALKSTTATFNGSSSTVAAPNSTVAAAAAAANTNAPTTGAKTTGFNFNPSTPLNFTFGAANANSAPKFGVSTSNGSLGSTGSSYTFTAPPPAGAKTTAFNFNPSTPPNFAFGATANSAPKFGVSTSNGSLGLTNSFSFTGAAPVDPLRGDNTSGRVVRKAKRRLNPTSK